MTVEKIIELLTLLIVVAPVVLQLIRYLGVSINNKSVITLADRAMIIVSSLDSLLIPNKDKKKEALEKLLGFAKEIGVSLTKEQAEDYIEHSVRELREFQGKTEVVTDASEEK